LITLFSANLFTAYKAVLTKPNILAVELQKNSGEIFLIVSVYFQPYLGYNNMIEELFDDLNVLTHDKSRHIVIIGGDFNARIGQLGCVGDDGIIMPATINSTRKSKDKVAKPAGVWRTHRNTKLFLGMLTE